MDYKYSRIVARDMREAVVNIYGSIGEQINGDSLASELNYLAKDSDVITLRINSMGGNLIQALSVIGAIIGSKAQTVALIEGIAGSSSAVIALSCKHIRMNDYARLMLHAPYYVDDKGNERKNLSTDEQSALTHTRGMLADLLSRRGKTKEEVEAILAKDSWYTAEEAKKQGFVDEIIDTGMATMVSGYSLDKLMAFVNDKNLPIDKNMKKINALLKLADDANEAEAYQAITGMTSRIAALETETSTLKAENQQLKQTTEADIKARVKNTIDKAVTDRKILESQRAEYTALAEKDFDNVKKILDGMPVLSKLEQGTGADQAKMKKFEGKTWDQLDRAGLLEELKIVNEVRFKELYKETYNKEFGK